MDISQEQLLNEDKFGDLQGQIVLDNHTLVLCHTAAVSNWNSVEE